MATLRQMSLVIALLSGTGQPPASDAQTIAPVEPFEEREVNYNGEIRKEFLTPDLKPFVRSKELLQFTLTWIHHRNDSFGIGWSLETKPPIGITFDHETLVTRVRSLDKAALEKAGIKRGGGGSYYIPYEYKGNTYNKWLEGWLAQEDEIFVITPKDSSRFGAAYESRYPIVVEVSQAYRAREQSFRQGYGVIRDSTGRSIELTPEILISLSVGKGGNTRIIIPENKHDLFGRPLYGLHIVEAAVSIGDNQRFVITNALIESGVKGRPVLSEFLRRAEAWGIATISRDELTQIEQIREEEQQERGR